MSDGEMQGEAQVEQLDAVEATNAFRDVRHCKGCMCSWGGTTTAEEIEAQEMGMGRTDMIAINVAEPKSTSHGMRDENPS